MLYWNWKRLREGREDHERGVVPSGGAGTAAEEEEQPAFVPGIVLLLRLCHHHLIRERQYGRHQRGVPAGQLRSVGRGHPQRDRGGGGFPPERGLAGGAGSGPTGWVSCDSGSCFWRAARNFDGDWRVDGGILRHGPAGAAGGEVSRGGRRDRRRAFHPQRAGLRL